MHTTLEQLLALVLAANVIAAQKVKITFSASKMIGIIGWPVNDSVHVAGIKYSRKNAEKAAVNMEKCTLSGLPPLLASREPTNPRRITVKTNSRARRPSPMMRGIVVDSVVFCDVVG